ncbi:hypothetical protein IQ277_29190 [Nostocales cyanobacterium LEGE 12452]|nr:hypothetical protein [Nostocales cyanobacterium LEGE 12452]
MSRHYQNTKVISHKEYTQVDEFRQLLETLRERSTLDPLVGEFRLPSTTAKSKPTAAVDLLTEIA